MEILQDALLAYDFFLYAIRQAQDVGGVCTLGRRGVNVENCGFLQLQLEFPYRLAALVVDLHIDEEQVSTNPSLAMYAGCEVYLLS